jgi:protein-disulfide isomerase/uncharacterized membrane protein
VVALAAALVGVALSAELLHTHRLANQTGAGPLWCDDLGEGVGCSSVARSPWAKVAGVPTAAWGLLTYVGLAALSVAGVRRRSFPSGPAGILLWLSGACLLFGLFLAYIMIAEVRSLCPSCLGLDTVNLVLFISGLLASRGRGPIGSLRQDLRVLASNRPLGIAVVLAPALTGLLVLLAYPREVVSERPARLPGELPELPDAGWYREPLDLDGVPCLGPPDATVVIYEFSDYQCPYCRRAHEEMRRVVDQLVDQVRFCHVHHPLDAACNSRLTRPFHPAACLAASAAICAQQQDRFWQMNDLLFQSARGIDDRLVARLARSLDLDGDRFAECVESDDTRARIEQELAVSYEVPVGGTPTFLVNGRIIAGALAAEDLEVVLRQLIEHRGEWPSAEERQ